MTFTYDYCGEPKPPDPGTIHVNLMCSTPQPGVRVNRGSVEPSAAPRQAGRAISEHTFEFRLSGFERQEQSWPRGAAAAPIVAIQRVRAYLTRQGEPAEATSAIGGVEVHAELRGADILCTAQLSDFGPGELVVVQVEVALFDLMGYLATFVGVNFSLLREYFKGGGRAEYVEPDGEEGRGIHARLLAPGVRGQESGVRNQGTGVMSQGTPGWHALSLRRAWRAARATRARPSRTQGVPPHHGATHQRAVGLSPAVRGCFTERFGDAAYKRQQEPIQKARGCAKAGRFELAMGFYREALALQPTNWVLLCEVSQFLTVSLRDPKAGADMAKVALELNPACSAELWNALGDALYELGAPRRHARPTSRRWR
jgi:hypothetical protein